MHEKVFNPAEVNKLEDPDRLNWLPADKVLSALSLRPGLVVADIGAGSGYFAIPIARAVAAGTPESQHGQVFAVDLQGEMLAVLRSKLARPGMPRNIELLLGSASDTTVPDASVDLVFLANIWHELDDYDAAAREAARILKPAGKLAILDWRPDVTRPPGPPIEHRLSPAAVAATLQAHGWRCSSPLSIGPYSYLLICARNHSS